MFTCSTLRSEKIMPGFWFPQKSQGGRNFGTIRAITKLCLEQEVIAP
ncbi:hypothetical protein CPter91_2411 [Collimonas pratensis]|uniref:Uncharacterized protein n=1 Tax=Collimonas pratensis TaxID=279113 RepID=A0A127Q3W2_9BURK|nr:hypothetical protein CPter91_2411 [Collimonas pratensis]